MAEVEVIKASDGFVNRRNRHIVGGGLTLDRKRVAAYCRVSTDDEEQLQSFQSQKTYYEEKISKNKEWALVNIYADGGNGGNHNDQKCEEYIKYLNYYNTNVFYLPGKMIPEEIVLKSKYAKEMYRSIMEQFEIINSKNAKDVIKAISNADHGDEEHINGTISILTNKWSQEESELRNELIDKLNTIFER